VSVDAIDLIPELPEVLPHFTAINFGLAERLHATNGASVRFVATDARHFVRATNRRYDVIVGDLFVPWRSGEGGMYTREHFRAVRDALGPGGLFCQWLPLYQVRPDELRTIVATFVDVFPHVSAWWLYFNAEEPAIGLVGSNDLLRFAADSLQARMREPGRSSILVEAGLRDPRTVLGSTIAGTARLREWSRGASIETEDHPRIEFIAPRGTFGNLPERSRKNLVEILTWITPIADDDPSFVPLGPHGVQIIRQYQRGVAFYMRGRFADLYTPDLAETMTAYSAAFRDIPDNTAVSLVLEQCVQRAIRERRLDLAEQGVAAFMTVPTHAYIGHYYAAERALALGDAPRAKEELRRALAANPEHGDSQRLLASLDAPRGAQP
jgi:hypothetical protein